MENSTERLGSAPLGRLLLSLSLPGMASMVTLALYNIIDTFWVSQLGHQAIAALTIVMPYHIVVIAVSVGTGIGISSLTSRRFGERNIEATNHVAGHIFIIAGFFGSIFLLTFIFFSQPLLIIGGATPDILNYATQYLVIIAFGTPFLTFSIMASELLRGSGDALRPMIFSITAAVTNIILDPFMIFGIGVFPEMGVRGAALATILSQLLGAGLTFFYIVILHRSNYQIKLRHLKPSLSILRDIYRVGFPSMITEFVESTTFIFFNRILSGFGSLALAAGGLAIRIIDFAFMPVFGASGGLLPIIGFCFGARLWHRLWGAVRLAALGLASILVIATIGMEIFSPQLIDIFTDDLGLMAQGIPAMRITISTLCLFGPSIIFITTFMGLGKGREVLLLSLARQLIFFLPALLILPGFMGINGVWLAIPVSDSAGFLVTGLWLFREYQLQKRSGVWPEVTAIDSDA
ncbi:MATE family efflux transporter [Chloroflexota bacterium]